jgi:hypothetical protein
MMGLKTSEENQKKTKKGLQNDSLEENPRE